MVMCSLQTLNISLSSPPHPDVVLHLMGSHHPCTPLPSLPPVSWPYTSLSHARPCISRPNYLTLPLIWRLKFVFPFLTVIFSMFPSVFACRPKSGIRTIVPDWQSIPIFRILSFGCMDDSSSDVSEEPGEVGEAKEGFAHSPTFPSLHLRHSSFSNHSVALPTSQLVLQPFRCFTYVTAHSPILLSLLLGHRLFIYVTWRAAHICLRDLSWSMNFRPWNLLHACVRSSLQTHKYNLLYNYIIVSWADYHTTPQLQPINSRDCSKYLY